jgi:hypothetical protein
MHRRGEPGVFIRHLCKRSGNDALKVRHLAKTCAGPPILQSAPPRLKFSGHTGGGLCSLTAHTTLAGTSIGARSGLQLSEYMSVTRTALCIASPYQLLLEID